MAKEKTLSAIHSRAPGQSAVSAVPGETLFAMFCSACHGADGLGTTMRAGLWPQQAERWDRLSTGEDRPVRGIVTKSAGTAGEFDLMVPSLNHPDTLAAASDDYLRWTIHAGRPGTNMLGWSAGEGGLTGDEIDRIVDFLRSREGIGPPLESISASRGDPRRGRALYRSRCVACHGRNGEGGIGVALNAPSYLAVASDEFLRDAIVLGRPNTAMPSWKQLKAQEVSDVIRYIRTWEQKPPDKDAVLAKLAEGKPSRRSLRVAKSLYRANCLPCHGSKGEGALGPSLNTDEFLAVVGDEYLYTAIVEGRPGTAMPAWKHFSVDDVADLINYLRNWNKRNRRELERYRAHGDWDRGGIIFQGACAGCHGSHAEGATGPQLSNPTFLASVSDAALREWISRGKSGTPMLGFLRGSQGLVDLTEPQIEDVISHLRRFEVGPRMVTARPGMGIVQLGAEIYASACASCHGADGEGATGSALSNPHFLRSASDGFIEATMVLGRDGTEMRRMARGGQGNVELSAEEISNVAAFIRSWERRPPTSSRGLQPARRYVTSADVEVGRELYAGHCAGCHGNEGMDGWAPALNNPEFLTAATDGFLQATIAVGRAGTAMRSFGIGGGGVAELSSEQINDVVAYVRTWAPAKYRPATTEEVTGRGLEAIRPEKLVGGGR